MHDPQLNLPLPSADHKTDITMSYKCTATCANKSVNISLLQKGGLNAAPLEPKIIRQLQGELASSCLKQSELHEITLSYYFLKVRN